MSVHTIGEIAAILGVAGGVVALVLWVANLRALHDIRDELRKDRQ